MGNKGIFQSTFTIFAADASGDAWSMKCIDAKESVPRKLSREASCTSGRCHSFQHIAHECLKQPGSLNTMVPWQCLSNSRKHSGTNFMQGEAVAHEALEAC